MTHYNEREFDILVNQKIADGYKMYGDPYSIKNSVYAQGMTKGDYRSKKK